MVESSTDQWPIYVGLDGEPLSFGRIYFYAVGSTDPKTVYTDRERLVPSTNNPILLRQDGRTPTQIFLGEGQYTTVLFKFNGVDPNTALEAEWAYEREFIQDGGTAATASTQTARIDNIEALRTKDGVTALFYDVSGYYAAGDMFTRTYAWNASSLAIDNGGTVIRNPAVSTGAWHLIIGNTDVIDVRIFGAIPGRSGSTNSQIASAVDAALSSNQPRTVYFPAGVYEVSSGTQTFSSHVKYEEGVVFKNLSVGDFVLQHLHTFECLVKGSLRAGTSTGKVILDARYVSGTEELDVKWYNCVANGSTDDYDAFKTMLANITPNYPIKLTSPMRLVPTEDVVVPNPLHTYNTGSFLNGQAAYTLTFNGAITSNNVNYPVFMNSNRGAYRFGMREVRSSWFRSTLLASAYAEDIDTVIKANNATTTSTMIFDMDTQFSALGILASESSNWSFAWERGILTTQGSNDMYLSSLQAPPQARVFADKPFYVGGISYAQWFPNISRAIKSAFAANGSLDLNNQAYNATASIAISVAGSKRTVIKNGDITLPNAINLFDISANVEEVDISKLNVYDDAGTSSFMRITNARIERLNVESCGMGSVGASGQVINMGTGASLGSVRFDKNTIYWNKFINSTTVIIPELRLNNNIITADAEFYATVGDINGNTINGNSNGSRLFNIGGSRIAINGNNFREVDLGLCSLASLLGHNVTGNTFSSTDSKAARVLFTTKQSNTIIRGSVVSNNSFVGVINGPAVMIDFAGSGTWNTIGHTFSVHDNRGEAVLTRSTPTSLPAQYRVLIPRTKGKVVFSKTKADINSSYTSLGKTFTINLAPTPEMLVVPGASMFPITTGCGSYTGTWATGAQGIGNFVAFNGNVTGYSTVLRLLYTTTGSLVLFPADAAWNTTLDFDLYAYRDA